MIAIVKYNAGNIKSVKNALNRLGCDSIITDSQEELKLADKIIFPGVGEAGSAMEYLKQKKLDEVIINLTQPVLGICLGLQLLCQHSEEKNTKCLGIFNSKVKKFPPKDLVPHIGWNSIQFNSNNIFSGVENDNDVYFVHSYYAEVCENTIATSNYITEFSSAMKLNNFYATQFHPEKSAFVGEKILENFLKL